MSDELSAYEAKRRERMAANRALLLSLNIERLPAKAKKQPQPKSEESVAPMERRMSRRLQMANQWPTAARIEVKVEAPRPMPKKRERPKDMVVGVDTTAAKIAKITKKEAGALSRRLPVVDLTPHGNRFGVHAPRAARDLKIDMRAFHKKWLGRQLYPIGCEQVLQSMAVSTGRRVVVGDDDCVQHWKNAIALMVTLDQDAEHVKRFSHVKLPTDGMPKTAVLFQWIAPPHWSSGASAQSLCRVQHGDRRLFYGGSPSNEASINQGDRYNRKVFLFLRPSSTGAFVYCGRLGFLGMAPSSHGVKFRWELLDTDSFNWPTVLHELTIMVGAVSP